MQSILKDGLIAECRSIAWGLADETQPDKRYAMGFGPLAEASYIAFEKYPDNPNIRSTIEQGIANCKEFHHPTPPATLKYRKRYTMHFMVAR